MGKERMQAESLLFMDNLKLFSKNEKQMDTLVGTVRLFSTDF